MRKIEVLTSYSVIAEYLQNLRKVRCNRVRNAYNELADALQQQYNAIDAYGIICIPQAINPYSTSAELWKDYKEIQAVAILSSETSPWPWSLSRNDAFRFVHDVIGHCGWNESRPSDVVASFGISGEVIAFRRHYASLVNKVSADALGALAAETIGQQSLFYAKLQGKRAEASFPDQLACILDKVFWKNFVSDLAE